MYDFQRNYKIDLHSHSTLSDGVLSPEELIKYAIYSGLKVLAITDHNCINDKHQELSNKYKDIISLPTACEFSASYETITGRKIQIHINGIGFAYNDKAVLKVLEKNNKNMRPYVERVLEKLKLNCGINLCSYNELLERSNSISLGRHHIAWEMVRQNIVKDVNDAFDKYLGDGKPAYISNSINYASLLEVVKSIVNSDGIAVLNHLLKYNLTFYEMDALLKEFKKLSGTHGALEVFYSFYDDQKQTILKCLADSYNLLYSCGSDFHGDKDSAIKELGRFSYDIYDKMIRTAVGLPLD